VCGSVPSGLAVSGNAIRVVQEDIRIPKDVLGGCPVIVIVAELHGPSSEVNYPTGSTSIGIFAGLLVSWVEAIQLSSCGET
jgi:hypothetical protein